MPKHNSPGKKQSGKASKVKALTGKTPVRTATSNPADRLPQVNKGVSGLLHEEIEAFAAKPKPDQLELTVAQWRVLAYTLVDQCVKKSRALTKKDLGNYQRLVTSAGIAMTKAYGDSPKDTSVGPERTFINLILGSVAPQLVETLTGNSPTEAKVLTLPIHTSVGGAKGNELNKAT